MCPSRVKECLENKIKHTFLILHSFIVFVRRLAGVSFCRNGRLFYFNNLTLIDGLDFELLPKSYEDIRPFHSMVFESRSTLKVAGFTGYSFGIVAWIFTKASPFSIRNVTVPTVLSLSVTEIDGLCRVMRDTSSSIRL